MKISRTALIEQGKITQQKILEYLALYKYSTARTISLALDIKYQTVISAIARYKKQNLINDYHIPAPKERVVGIAWLGICDIGLDNKSLVFHASRFNERTLHHWLQCQKYAYLQNKKGIKCVPAQNGKIGVRGKGRVDLVETITNQNQQQFKVGIEIERTPKNPSRYLEIWGGHIEAIQNNQYSGVKYVLSSKQAEVVKKIFDRTDHIITSDKRRIAFEPFKGYFKFTTDIEL